MSITHPGGGPKVCPATTSRTHETRAAATAYLQEHEHKARKGRLKVSEQCERCKGWHIVARERDSYPW